MITVMRVRKVSRQGGSQGSSSIVSVEVQQGIVAVAVIVLEMITVASSG